MKKTTVMISIVMIILGLMAIGCSRDAEVASYNVSQDADNFKIYRRVIFYNSITDQYIMTIEGYCSIEITDNVLRVLVKTENGSYLKHYLGLSDNVTYFAEQLQPSGVSDKHYKVIFKPTVIVPTVEVR